VAQKLVSDNVVDSADMADYLMGVDQEAVLPQDFYSRFRIQVPLGSHPLYEKFFKMLSVGIAKEAVQMKMAQEGLDSAVLNLDPQQLLGFLDRAPSATQNSTSQSSSSAPSTGSAGSAGGGSGEKMLPAGEHPMYAKFFKMAKVGLPKEAVKIKMQQEGVDPTVLDKSPQDLIPESGIISSASSSSSSAAVPMVPVSEHPKYAKYFKMLKMGLPKGAVVIKMQQEDANPAMLDKNPQDLIPESESAAPPAAAVEMVPISEHPQYSKYFKMLKMGLPKGAVANKMQQEGANPAMLDKDPADKVPLNEGGAASSAAPANTAPMVRISRGDHPQYATYFKKLQDGAAIDEVKAEVRAAGLDAAVLDKNPKEEISIKADEIPKVPAGEHPQYSKFFKMLKVGLPLAVVKAKAQQEGLDPSILDKDPTELVSLVLNAKPEPSPSTSPKPAPQPKVRKKKLYWKALDASKVQSNSLWAEENDVDLEFDEEEFNQLFVESASAPSSKPVVSKPKEVKKQKVILIDRKRAQNAGIALARIKFSPEDLKQKVLTMDDEGINTDQLKSLIEFLPTPEEVGILKAYKGEIDLLGHAEKYMLVMMGFNTASKHIRCMIYKQQFKPRYLECRGKIAKIQNACDDVKMSTRLRKVLKVILKVGNQLNDGEAHKGFTVDSLLKLNSAKAFDKKTSVLQYVITLIFRNDEDCLRFPDDLKHVSEAARMSMDTIISEKNGLLEEFNGNLRMLEEIRSAVGAESTDPMLDFFVKVIKILLIV
jgi:hypothetical protein